MINKLSEDVHQIFPLSGTVISKEKVQSERNWYMVKLDQPLEHFTVCKEFVMIKTKNNTSILANEKETVVGLYLIKSDDVIQKTNKSKSDFVYVDWAAVIYHTLNLETVEQNKT
jgi:hypothetical protein